MPPRLTRRGTSVHLPICRAAKTMTETLSMQQGKGLVERQPNGETGGQALDLSLQEESKGNVKAN